MSTAEDRWAEERRIDTDAAFAHHELLAKQIAELSLHRANDDKRLSAMEKELRANTEATARIDKATAGMVSMFVALEGGLKVLGWLGNIGKVLLQLGAVIGGGYATFLAIKASLPHWWPK